MRVIKLHRNQICPGVFKSNGWILFPESHKWKLQHPLSEDDKAAQSNNRLPRGGLERGEGKINIFKWTKCQSVIVLLLQQIMSCSLFLDPRDASQIHLHGATGGQQTVGCKL